MSRKRRHIAQIKLDQGHFKNKKGKWITSRHYNDSPAEEWQLEELTKLGAHQIKGIRFFVAVELLNKLRRVRKVISN